MLDWSRPCFCNPGGSIRGRTSHLRLHEADPMKRREYTEGPEAFENFERFATAVLQAPKPTPKAKTRFKTTTSRKSKNADKD